MDDDLHFFSEVVINDVLNGQRAKETSKAGVAKKTLPKDQMSNLQVTVSQEPRKVVMQQQKSKETMQALPEDTLWRSPLMQNYVHRALRQDQLLEPMAIGQLAVHLGVTYSALQHYLDDVYPQRRRLWLTDE